MQLDNLLGNRQAQPGAHACGFGGEERIINPGQVLLRNAAAGVLHLGNHRQVAHPEMRRAPRAFEVGRLGQLFGVSARRQRASFGHGMDGVEENIHEDLLNLSFVHSHRREPLPPFLNQMNAFLAQLMPD